MVINLPPDVDSTLLRRILVVVKLVHHVVVSPTYSSWSPPMVSCTLLISVFVGHMVATSFQYVICFCFWIFYPREWRMIFLRWHLCLSPLRQSTQIIFQNFSPHLFVCSSWKGTVLHRDSRVHVDDGVHEEGRVLCCPRALHALYMCSSGRIWGRNWRCVGR